MCAALLRASRSWRRIVISEFELKQIEGLRNELDREFEERTGASVSHVVFVDGRVQWSHRQSDLRRFIDLFHQGLIDYLIVGKEVETEWEPLLTALLQADQVA